MGGVRYPDPVKTLRKEGGPFPQSKDLRCGEVVKKIGEGSNRKDHNLKKGGNIDNLPPI